MILGNHKVPQKDIVKWHAQLTQIENDLLFLLEEHRRIKPETLHGELGDLVADVNTLRSKLPSVQQKLPLK